jgi:hypothetical protein
MTTNAAWRDVPLPPGLDQRPKDARGYPVTFVTLIDPETGRPDFTTIDGAAILQCVQHDLCGLCGLEHDGPYAFIGGPLSCENHNFLDPPMHVACAEYAMQVCPHLAISTSRYAKPNLTGGRELFPLVSDERPEKFGLYVTKAYRIVNHEGQPVFLTWEPDEIRWSA